LEQVRADVWALPQAIDQIEGSRRLAYSLSYLLRDSRGDFHIIDPGIDSEANFHALEAALASLGASLGALRSVTATHHHPDHLGLARRLRTESGASIQLGEAEHALSISGHPIPPPTDLARLLDGWGVPEDRREELAAARSVEIAEPWTPDHTIVDRERLDIPGFDLVAVATPGHTPGHLAFSERSRLLFFSGDHVLPMMHAGLYLGGSDGAAVITDYLDSLARVRVFRDHEALPGHGYRFAGLAARADEGRGHHLRRSAEVRAALERMPDATVWQVARQLTWTSGWEALRGFSLYSALYQTEMHSEFLGQVSGNLILSQRWTAAERSEGETSE